MGKERFPREISWRFWMQFSPVLHFAYGTALEPICTYVFFFPFSRATVLRYSSVFCVFRHASNKRNFDVIFKRSVYPFYCTDASR